jgi:hypothetical protein
MHEDQVWDDSLVPYALADSVSACQGTISYATHWKRSDPKLLMNFELDMFRMLGKNVLSMVHSSCYCHVI